MARESRTELKSIKTPLFSRLAKDPRHIAVPILQVGLSAMALIAIGLVMVYSSSSFTSMIEQGNATKEAIKQFAFVGAGVLIAFGVSRCPDGFLKGPACFFLWAVSVALIVATVFAGTEALGAQRWLLIGGMSIQPSEFAKIAFVLMGARIITRYRAGEVDSRLAMLQFFGYVVVPLIVVLFTQSDLGTTAICGVAIVVMVWLGGVDRRLVVGILVLALVCGMALVLTSSYRMERATSFMDPWANPDQSGYQLIHGLQALAAGGLFGQGIGNSLEKLAYLPEAETDFIFSIIGEEMGLVGALLVVALFCIFLMGSIRIAQNATTDFGMIVAGTLGAMLVFQAFLNIMCNVGLAPITGKPLPFISSGGSSMISSCLCVGIILAIGRNERLQAQQHARKRESLHVVSTQTGRRQPADRDPRFDSRYPTENGSRARGAVSSAGALRRDGRMATPGVDRVAGARARSAAVPRQGSSPRGHAQGTASRRSQEPHGRTPGRTAGARDHTTRR